MKVEYLVNIAFVVIVYWKILNGLHILIALEAACP